MRQSFAVKQLCDMIAENDTLQHLVLQNCNINGNTLNVIADALTRNSKQNMKSIDIRNNPILDPQYKVLLSLTMNNTSLKSVEYTLYDEANIHAVEVFK